MAALAGLLIAGGGYLLPRIEYWARPQFQVIVVARVLSGFTIGSLLALLLPLLPIAKVREAG